MPDNSNGIDNIVDKDYFNSLISGLKEDEKLIVSLKVLSNFPFRKISQVMNIPIGTVQWKYYKAINSLKISIGSLVGAMLAFIIVIARGEFWKKQEYKIDHTPKDTEKHNYNKADKQEDAVINDQTEKSENANESQINSSTDTKEDNKTNEVVEPQDNINNETNKEETNQIIVVEGNQKFPDKVFDKLDGIQIASLAIGIVLFVISIVFFKKYQQKRKFKSSK